MSRETPGFVFPAPRTGEKVGNFWTVLECKDGGGPYAMLLAYVKWYGSGRNEYAILKWNKAAGDYQLVDTFHTLDNASAAWSNESTL